MKFSIEEILKGTKSEINKNNPQNEGRIFKTCIGYMVLIELSPSSI